MPPGTTPRSALNTAYRLLEEHLAAVPDGRVTVAYNAGLDTMAHVRDLLRPHALRSELLYEPDPIDPDIIELTYADNRP